MLEWNRDAQDCIDTEVKTIPAREQALDDDTTVRVLELAADCVRFRPDVVTGETMTPPRFLYVADIDNVDKAVRQCDDVSPPSFHVTATATFVRDDTEVIATVHVRATDFTTVGHVDDTIHAVTDVEIGTTTERPEACECRQFTTDTSLPCWPCFREGFETVAND